MLASLKKLIILVDDQTTCCIIILYGFAILPSTIRFSISVGSSIEPEMEENHEQAT